MGANVFPTIAYQYPVEKFRISPCALPKECFGVASDSFDWPASSSCYATDLARSPLFAESPHAAVVYAKLFNDFGRHAAITRSQRGVAPELVVGFEDKERKVYNVLHHFTERLNFHGGRDQHVAHVANRLASTLTAQLVWDGWDDTTLATITARVTPEYALAAWRETLQIYLNGGSALDGKESNFFPTYEDKEARSKLNCSQGMSEHRKYVDWRSDLESELNTLDTKRSQDPWSFTREESARLRELEQIMIDEKRGDPIFDDWDYGY